MTEEEFTAPASISRLNKTPTGIHGLDEILEGGLPAGRTTLVCGGPGCGKTLLATEFLAHGALDFNEPGVFVAFEETAEELGKNSASLGFHLDDLVARKLLVIDYIAVERSEIEETGDYDLEGLFIRLNYAIESIGAKRVVLDTLEVLFAGFSNVSILRSEIRRLFRWLKDRGVTAVVTGEMGENTLTRYGLEEYVSDCVITLENRVENKIANRILRVVKFRGSSHGNDEYPFLIGNSGLWVQPVTTLSLQYKSSREIISSGIPGLDKMLGKGGFYRGSSILVSGTAGTGKTSIAASMVDAACRRGERCLYFAFEESTDQIVRNMRSINIDLQPWVDQGLLHFQATRPTQFGPEMHLLRMQQLTDEFHPTLVVADPLTDLVTIGSASEVKSMLVRLIDYLKMKQVTAFFTSLTPGDNPEMSTSVGISSLMDAWILVRNLEFSGERNRGIYVLKARGMPHSAQVREFKLTGRGIDLVEAYLSPHGFLIGSAREVQAARDWQDARQRQVEIDRRQRELKNKRKAVEAQIVALNAELEAEEEQLSISLAQDEKLQAQWGSDLGVIADDQHTGS
jgi:circadian clock protein KaiC